MLYEFREAEIPPEYILDLLPPIRPRGFSISSSPNVSRCSLSYQRPSPTDECKIDSPTTARSTSLSRSSSTRRSSLSRARVSQRPISRPSHPVRPFLIAPSGSATELELTALPLACSRRTPPDPVRQVGHAQAPSVGGRTADYGRTRDGRRPIQGAARREGEGRRERCVSPRSAYSARPAKEVCSIADARN